MSTQEAGKQIGRRAAIGKLGRLLGGAAVLAEAPLLMGSIGCSTPELEQEWKNFDSGNFSYSISYPGKWAAKSARIPGDTGLDVFVQDINDTFKASISINVPEQESEDDLTTAAARALVDTQLDLLLLGARAELVDEKNPQSETPDPDGLTRIADQFDAYHFRLRYPRGRQKLEQHIVVFIAGGITWHGILITYESEAKKQLPVFKKMLDSFRIDENKDDNRQRRAT